MLVAPVWQAAQSERTVYLPEGSAWTHAWSGEQYNGGTEVTVASPLGQPPVFYREDSPFADRFAELRML